MGWGLQPCREMKVRRCLHIQGIPSLGELNLDRRASFSVGREHGKQCVAAGQSETCTQGSQASHSAAEREKPSSWNRDITTIRYPQSFLRLEATLFLYGSHKRNCPHVPCLITSTLTKVSELGQIFNVSEIWQVISANAALLPHSMAWAEQRLLP